MQKQAVSPMGCLRDARLALQKKLRLLAAGGYRDVYEDGRGRFVYKVARYDGEEYCNKDEHEAARAAREKGVPGIPRTYLWWVDGKPVLCMRKFPQPDERPTSDRLREAIARWRAEGFGDLHGYNYTTTKSGQPRLLDMQYYSERAA